ncbi:MAG: DMT family transporter [Firmicutes bacterium]|nr:DMT family transporter [Bacillota bacterium]
MTARGGVKVSHLGTYLGLVLTSFFWGTSFAAAKIGMSELLPVNLVILRFILASLLFGVALIFLRRNVWRIELADLPRLVWLGFLGVSAYFVVQYYGLTHTTSVNTALIIGTSPIITGLLAARVGGERLVRQHYVGMLVAFVGLFLLITKGNFYLTHGESVLKGDLLILFNAVMWSCFTLAGKRVVGKYDPFVVVAYLSLLGTLLLLPLAFISTPLTRVTFVQQLPTLSLATWGAAGYLALTCSVIGYFFWYRGVQRLGAAKTAMFTYLNPLVALVTSLILFDENITGLVLVGGALVLTGVYLTTRTRADEPQAEMVAEQKVISN